MKMTDFDRNLILKLERAERTTAQIRFDYNEIAALRDAAMRIRQLGRDKK